MCAAICCDRLQATWPLGAAVTQGLVTFLAHMAAAGDRAEPLARQLGVDPLPPGVPSWRSRRPRETAANRTVRENVQINVQAVQEGRMDGTEEVVIDDISSKADAGSNSADANSNSANAELNGDGGVTDSTVASSNAFHEVLEVDEGALAALSPDHHREGDETQRPSRLWAAEVGSAAQDGSGRVAGTGHGSGAVQAFEASQKPLVCSSVSIDVPDAVRNAASGRCAMLPVATNGTRSARRASEQAALGRWGEAFVFEYLCALRDHQVAAGGTGSASSVVWVNEHEETGRPCVPPPRPRCR